MGKKSRRQRAKDPISSFQSQFLQANALPGEGRRQTMQRFAHQFFPEGHKAFRGVAHDDDGDSELDAVQDAAPAASKPTVAEAEAEYNAATTPDGFTEERARAQAVAIMSLRAALTTDEDDRKNFEYYMQIVAATVPGPGSKTGNETLLKAMKRWPRYRNYWPRLRRRLCWGCGKQYDLSEPRLWVCGACGEARYCDEACQREHWPAHKRECLHAWTEKVEQRLSQGVSREELQQELDDWYQNG